MIRLLFSSFFLFCIHASSIAFNEIFYWIGGASGDWTTSANWSNTPGGAPASSYPQNNDEFYFNTGGNIQVNYNLPSSDASFKNFRISNNTNLTLTNTISPSGNNRAFTINNGNNTAYYEIIEAGSTLTMRNNSSLCYFSLGSDVMSSGRMVINGNIFCIQSSFSNTNIGPRLNAKDSIIINGLYYIGNPSSATVGGNPINNNFRFGPNGVYQIDKDGGIFPFAKWEKGSLIKITGTRANFPNYWNGVFLTGFQYQLGGIEIDVPNANSVVTTSINIPQGTIIQNDFIIRNLGTSGGIRLSGSMQYSGITIEGNLMVEKGKLEIANTSSGLTSILVKGNMEIKPAATLDLLSGSSSTSCNIDVKGNVSLNGQILETGNSTNVNIRLTGTSNQQIEVLGNISNSVNLVINNGNQVIALSDITWSSNANAKLVLENGHLNMALNQKKIIIANPSANAITGGSIQSHIIGTLVRRTQSIGTFDFPVADNPTDYAPLSLTTTAATLTDWSCDFFKNNPNGTTGLPVGINVIEPYRWLLTCNNASSASSISLKYAEIIGNGIVSPSEAKVVYWNNPNWISLGGSSSNPGFIATTNPTISQFGNFSIGYSNNSPLLNPSRLSLTTQACINTTTIDSITFTGSNLVAGDITIGPLNGFTFSNSFNGSYQPTLTINQNGGTLAAQKIFIRFSPTSAQSYTGNFTIQGGGANAVSININATGLQPTTPTFSQISPVCRNGNFNLSSTSLNSINGSWSPAPNYTQTTTYTFTPNQGTCATTTTQTVVIIDSIIPSFTAIAPICSGQNIAPLPVISNNNINGTWSPSINNTQTTTYFFTPAAGTCAQQTSITLVVNQPTTPTFNPVAPICVGGVINPLPTVSNNGISGTWSPAPNNNQTTTYTFTPSVNECATSTTLTIQVGANPVPTFDLPDTICAGQTISPLPTTSLNGILGVWSPALNNNQTTTYTFTPNADQCAQSISIVIHVNPTIQPIFDSIPSICAGATLSALPTTSNNNIEGTWSPAINNTQTTTYTFSPTSNACALNASLTIVVNPCNAFIYPNPNQGIFNLKVNGTSNTNVTVQIFDARGAEIFKRAGTPGLWPINLRSSQSGVYWINVVDNAGNVIQTGKVLLQH
jgi:hypothetical protein